MTFSPRVSTLLSTLITLHLVACTEAKTPTLVGRWEATSAPAGYATATLVLDSVSIGCVGFPCNGPLQGMLSLQPNVGSAAVGLHADVYETAGGIQDFDHVSLDVNGIAEFSATKENCDGDNFIDPTQPLCRFFGNAIFTGALRDGRLIGSFGASSCADYGSAPCEVIDLAGAITFVRR